MNIHIQFNKALDAIKALLVHRESLTAPITMVIILFLFFLDYLPYQDALRTLSFDTYQMIRPRERISAPVTIVNIDEQSLEKYGQWPWPRSLMAQLLDRVTEAKPASVAFDILMPESDRSSPCQITQYVPGISPALVKQTCALPSNDRLLSESIRRSTVSLGIAGLDSGGGPVTNAPPVRIVGEDPKPWIRHFNSALSNIPELQNAASGHAILSADMDRGVIHRIPVIAAIGNAILPTLSLEMIRLAVGSSHIYVKSLPGRIVDVGVDDLSIPTQEDGSVWVHYSPHDASRFISAASILGGKFDPELIHQKLVLIGFSGLGLVDFPSTALGERVPGVEIHAQLLESIFDGTTLFRPHWAKWMEGGLMIVLGLSVLWGFPRIKPLILLPIMLLVIGLMAGAGFIAYSQYHLLFDVSGPALFFIALFGTMQADTLVRDEIQRKALERDLQLQRERAAKIQGEMEAAKRIQMGILPDAKSIAQNENRLDIAAKMEPAKTVGGDLYDCFMVDQHHLFFSVGDVSGKGVPASLFMAISKTLCKSVALRDDANLTDIGSLINLANMEIARDNPEMLFVTAFVGLLDLRNGELHYCNAGHEPPLLVAPGCHARELEGNSGPPLCMMDDFEYSAFRYRLSSEEFLCIFTDGATEAFNLNDEEYGKERIIEALSDISTDTNSGELLEVVFKDVQKFVGEAEPSDDLTVMLIRWKGH